MADEAIRKELEAEFEQHSDYIVKLLEYKGLIARGYVNLDTIDTLLGELIQVTNTSYAEVGVPAITGYLTDGTTL